MRILAYGSCAAGRNNSRTQLVAPWELTVKLYPFLCLICTIHLIKSRTYIKSTDIIEWMNDFPRLSISSSIGQLFCFDG